MGRKQQELLDYSRATATTSDEDPYLISAHGLGKSYTAKNGTTTVALENASFDIRKGEFVSVVGPSGCGKTTLLKILGGLVSGTEGEVSLKGKTIAGPTSDVGFVFQSPTLLPWRTILRNVEVPIDVQGLSRAKYRPRAKELLKMAGLDGFEDRYPNELSGGMAQRAGICRGLVHDPEVLLMDEPFSALDAMTREQMALELQNIWLNAGKSVVFVTHSIPEAVFLADRVIVMSPRPGRIVEIVDVKAPRPRRWDMISEPSLGEPMARIRHLFESLEPNRPKLAIND
jgi:NitT/TauT family transport system ATP-binding protein